MDDSLRRKMIAQQSGTDALHQQRLKVNYGTVLLPMALAQLTSLQDLLDRRQQTIRVGEHHFVEMLPLLLFRSEEHTSELQSHVNLVCRLLLEKKKKNHTTRTQLTGVASRQRATRR